MAGTDLSKVEIWKLAIRPKTLPAALGPVFVGTAFALHFDTFQILPALAAMIGAVLLQIASNLANDYFDYLKGYDTEERIGPVRVAASGLLSIEELRNGLVLTIILSMIIGLYLIYVGGIAILIIGLLSILFALAYSGGPFPLASNGLGDLFVFIFFGLVAVNGTYFVQSGEIATEVIIGSIPVGLLITAILVVNNYRDIETDQKTGKFTLAVGLGHKWTRVYYLALLVISYAVPIVLFLSGNYTVAILLPLISIPLGVKHTKTLYDQIDGPKLNQALAGTAKLGLIYSILFSVGIII